MPQTQIEKIVIVIAKITDSFFDLMFPKFCVGCKKEGAYLCRDCKDLLQIYHFPFCPMCKNKISNREKCSRHQSCKQSRVKLCLSPFSYDNILIKNLIHNFKYEFIKSIGPELAVFMTESIKKSALLNRQDAIPLNRILIIPVPLHRRRLAWRGFNQSEILAREIAKDLSLELFRGLKRIRNTKPQIDMPDREKRDENIKDAFVCEKPKKIKHKIVILIDDMITTGATIEECAKVLKKSGAKEVWALTVAK